MKKLWCVLLCAVASLTVFAQTANFVTETEYSYRKNNGTLVGDEIILSNGMVNPNSLEGGVHYIKNFTPEKATGCSGYFDAPGPAYNITWSTDDGSAPVINLPFTFCFFGDNYTSVYMNNNGNISFQNSISSFSSSAFPSSGNRMIAAFWADFDFGGCGTMHATVTPTAAIFNWVDAGYFYGQCDKRNTCQIVITNGSDPLVIDGNCAIHYDDMSWTTGSASGGTNGFGGTPATCGANRGNNVDYFQIGRFDHVGTDYDGPNGANDGVDFLDNKSYFFDFCAVMNGNLAPIPLQNNACDTFGVCNTGDTLDLTFPFIGPENNQVTTVTYSAPTLNNVQVLSNTSGYTGEITLRIIGSQQTIGVHDIVITGTDNFVPNGVTSVTYQVEVTDPSNAFPVLPLITYTPGCAPVELAISNAVYDGYLWSTGSTDSTAVISNQFNGTVNVTVENGGCVLDFDTTLYIPGTPNFNLQGSLFYCPDNLTTHLELPDSMALDSAHWFVGVNLIEEGFTADLGMGTYTLTILDSTGFCSSDTTFTIVSQPNLVLENDAFICSANYTFTGNTGGVGAGVWSVVGNPNPLPTFTNNNLNTQVTLPGVGAFSLVYTENGCQDKDTVVVTWEATPIFNFPSDLLACPGSQLHLVVNDSVNMSSISWGFSDLSIDTLFSADLDPGTYTVTAASLHNCTADTTFTVTTQEPIQINYFDIWCEGDTIKMNDNTGYPTGIWNCYNCPGTAIYQYSDSLNTDIVVSEYGTYNFIFTDENCADDDTLTIAILPFAYVDLPDYTICSGYNQEIPASIYEPNFVTSIEWTANGNSTIIGASNTYSTSEEGIYYCKVTNACGNYTDSSIITAKNCDIELPNGFTPNGDGSNEFFHIIDAADLDFFKSFNIVITNRWGTIVAEFDTPQFEWDGKDEKGNLLDSGVYFYNLKSITIEDVELNKQGFVHLFAEK